MLCNVKPVSLLSKRLLHKRSQFAEDLSLDITNLVSLAGCKRKISAGIYAVIGIVFKRQRHLFRILSWRRTVGGRSSMAER